MPRPPHRTLTESGLRPLSVVAVFQSHLVWQEDLCTALEALADSLPARFDTHSAKVLVSGLHPTLFQAHRFEEEVAFPILLARHIDLAITLDRLRGEHIEDQDRAIELQEAVADLVQDRSRRNAEVVGYMLRCLFSGLRRHLALEREHLLPRLGE